MIGKKKILLRITTVAFFLAFFFVPLVLSASNLNPAKNHEIIFLLDASNSMNTTDPSYLAADSIKQMIHSLPSNYSIGFIAYDNGVQVLQSFDATRAQIHEAISQVNYTGYTNAGAGMEKALQIFTNDRNIAKTIVLISDGEIMLDSAQATGVSLEKFNRAMQEGLAKGINIYTLAIGGRQNAPQSNIFGINKSNEKIYEITSPEELPEIAKKILFSDLGVQKSSVSAGGSSGSILQIKIPAAHADKAKILITSDQQMPNLTASYNAENGEIITGKRFGLIEIVKPQTQDAQIQLASAQGGTIRADLMLEMQAVIKTEISSPTAENNGSGATAEVKLIPVGRQDQSIRLLDDMYFENKTIHVTADGEKLSAKITGGAIVFSLPAEESRSVQVKIDFAEIGINMIAPEFTSVKITKPNGYEKILAAVALLLTGTGIFIWRRNKKPEIIVPPEPMPSRYEFAGKLNIYVTKSPDDSDIAPQIYNLYRLFSRDEISLGAILEKCGIQLSFDGAYKIMFSPGASKAIVLTNHSDCTILKNRDLLIKNHSYLFHFEEKISITFEDEHSEIVLHYKNVKPSEKR